MGETARLLHEDRNQRKNQQSKRRLGMDRKSDRFPDRNWGKNNSYKAFLGGLPFSCVEEDIVEFLRMPEDRIESIRIVRNEHGESRGFCYVEFVDESSLQEALKLDGQFLRNREVRVDFAEDKRSGFRSNRGFDRRGGGGDRARRSEDRNESWRNDRAEGRSDRGNWGRRDKEKRFEDPRRALPERRSAPPEKRRNRRKDRDGWTDGDNERSVIQDGTGSRPTIFGTGRQREEIIANRPNKERSKVEIEREEEDEGYREIEVKKADRPRKKKSNPEPRQNSDARERREKLEKREKREKKAKIKKKKESKEGISSLGRFGLLASLDDDEEEV